MTVEESPPEGPKDRRAEIDALMDRFRQDQSENRRQWMSAQSQVPRGLHHYTTIEGLVGITSACALWASDVRYMNDSSELSYAAGLIQEVVADVLSGVSNPTVRDALPAHRDGLANAFEYGARPFVACFCEYEDLLSQWRGYGTGQAGVSLGLNLSRLAQIGHLPPNTYLRKVVYDADLQRESVRTATESWLQTAETLLDSGTNAKAIFPYPAIWALQQALAEHHLCLKHPGYAEEQEWRLIKLVDVREELRLLDDKRRDEMMAATRQRMFEMGVDMPNHSTAWSHARAEGIDIRFRTSPLGIVPYVELPLREFAGLNAGQLPLTQVVHSPTTNPDLALESLHMFLESRGYGFHTDIKLSGIPLRR